MALLCSGVALTGCFPWGSRATHKLPDVTALEQTYEYAGDVIVVGAGAAGLAAARVLEQNGISYTVLEATDRYGGRLKKDEQLADFPIDLGAEWLHNVPEVLDVLSGEEGTAENLDLIPYKVDSYHRWNGSNLTQVPQSEVSALYDFFPESKFKDSTWYDFVSTHFGERVDQSVRYDAPVTQIDYSGDKVAVTTADGQVTTADKVLVTVSVGVLRSGDITFVPELTETRRERLEGIEYLPGIKLILKFTEDFYPDVVEVQTSGGEKGFYDMAFGKDTQDHILGLLATGSSTEPYLALPSGEEVAAAAIEELDAIFDGKASESFTGEFIYEDWARQTYIQGSWVAGYLIGKPVREGLNESLDRKVYFAGEAYDIYNQMGVPGAILSGLYAVDRLLLGED